MVNRFSWIFVLGMATIAGVAATQALTQAPTDAQRNAIKSSCRSDYIAHCSSVPPGGSASVQCLQKNMTSLSSACQTALRTIEPAADTKPAAAPAAESKPAVIEAGKPAAEPAKSAAEPAPAAAPAKPATAARAEPAKPAASAAAAPAVKPNEAQVAAIRSACGSDYPKVCSSVPPGGAAALQCLEQNKAKVSPSCAKAIAAGSGGGGTAPAPAAAATAAAPGTAATTTAAAHASSALVLRPLRPLEELRIVRAACGSDARAFCGGVEPGGGRVAQCLAANAGALSPACRGMLAEFAANR